MEFFIVWLGCAAVTAAIGSSKGRSGVGWFFIGAILGIFGIILVACLPSLETRPSGRSRTYYDHAAGVRTLPPSPAKKCPDCAEDVKVDARICRFCRHDFTAVRSVKAS
ncbi:zinc ribbon domain-containing protein [Mesorhizobium newzealandense]|uniref:Zinc ribbon domain-containing protein n=1 Tax=Mesorhizobium newzealandense TaxID=1300302 RepID=A0ABW4UIJ2_9HYPH